MGNLAEKLDRRRREIAASREQMIDGATRGLKVQELGAKKKVENDRLREANQFNPINAVLEGGSAFVLSGGNPLAAVTAAATSKRGKTDVVGATLGSGVSKGVSIKNLGGGKDASKTIQALGKEENLDKTIATLKTHGVPDKVVKPLEDYSKTAQKQQLEKEKLKVKQAKDIVSSEKETSKSLAEKTYNKWETQVADISMEKLQKASSSMISIDDYIRTLESSRAKVSDNASLSIAQKDKLKSKIDAKIKEAKKKKEESNKDNEV